jgi:hypothetical protein
MTAPLSSHAQVLIMAQVRECTRTAWREYWAETSPLRVLFRDGLCCTGTTLCAWVKSGGSISVRRSQLSCLISSAASQTFSLLLVGHSRDTVRSLYGCKLYYFLDQVLSPHCSPKSVPSESEISPCNLFTRVSHPTS